MMYQEQQLANIQAFLEDSYYTSRLLVLKKIISSFSKNNINWALACSSPLFFMGIQDDFHDFDLLIAPKDTECVDSLLSSLGTKIIYDDKRHFDDDYFGRFTVDNVNLDVISEFGVTTFGTGYKYTFNPNHLSYITICDDVEVPLVPLEAQWLLYAMMTGWQPQRRFKKDLVGTYLNAKGLAHPEIFKTALKMSLPYWIKNEIKEFLMKK